MKALSLLVRPAIFILGLVPWASSSAAEFVLSSTSYSIVAPTAAIAAERQRELEWSARVFETLMGVTPPRGRVVLSDAPRGGVMTSDGASAAVTSAVPLTPQAPAADGTVWNLSWFVHERTGFPNAKRAYSVLTHEAAHLQLVYAVNFHAADVLREAFTGYGSFLPDWLDEAVAVYCEPDALKALRRKRFAIDRRIPLRTFFAMNHPGATGEIQMIQVSAKTAEEAREKVAQFGATQNESLTRKAEAMNASAATVEEFYTQALAVIEYMTDRGGLPFFRFVVVQQNYGKHMDEVLRIWQVKQKQVARDRAAAEKAAEGRKVLQTPPTANDPAGPLPPWPVSVGGVLVRRDEVVNAMPTSIEALEADFVRWAKKNYPGYRPKLAPSPHR